MVDQIDPTTAIHLEHVHKQFGDLKVIKGMDLVVPANMIFGFLGPNGSGKTTVMNMLAGLSRPTSGTARVFGLDVTRHGVQTRSIIGFLRQDPRYYEWMTPRETLAFTGRLFGFSRGEIHDRIDHLLDLVELGDARDRRMGVFSGGMRQRLSLEVTDMDAARREVPKVVVGLPVLFERCMPQVQSLEDLFLTITGGYRSQDHASQAQHGSTEAQA